MTAAPKSSERTGEEKCAVAFDSVDYAYPRAGASSSPDTLALKSITFQARMGEFVSIVGPSGCGKSTLLGLIAGLTRPSAGRIALFGREVSGVSKDVGFIFQRDALLPWRVALDNVAVGMRYRGVPKRQARERAAEWLERVGLGHVGGHYPHQLSGGMRKRVAIAATLASEPKVLLMDEPFSALDSQTRNLMESDLLDLWEKAGGQTVLFVTHDLEEAIGLSDRVVVLSAGPASVLSEYEVPTSRPRDLIDGRFSPDFMALYEKIWGDLRDQVQFTYRREIADFEAD